MTDQPHHRVRPELLEYLTPIGQLSPWPGNAKLHDLEAIRASYLQHGQYRPLVAQTSTGHVLAGNGQLAVMLDEGWTHTAATWLDVDEDQARRIVAVDNRTHDRAGYDPHALVDELLKLAGSPLGLEGSGYDQAFLDDLLAVTGDLPDLDDLASGIGDPTDDDGLVRITLRCTPGVAQDWKRLCKATRQADPIEQVERIIELAQAQLAAE